MKDRIILYYNPPPKTGYTLPHDQMLEGYTITADKRLFSEVRMVIFGLNRLSILSMLRIYSGCLRVKKRNGQLWVSRTMECNEIFNAYFHLKLANNGKNDILILILILII